MGEGELGWAREFQDKPTNPVKAGWGVWGSVNRNQASLLSLVDWGLQASSAPFAGGQLVSKRKGLSLSSARGPYISS